MDHEEFSEIIYLSHIKISVFPQRTVTSARHFIFDRNVQLFTSKFSSLGFVFKSGSNWYTENLRTDVVGSTTDDCHTQMSV